MATEFAWLAWAKKKRRNFKDQILIFGLNFGQNLKENSKEVSQSQIQKDRENIFQGKKQKGLEIFPGAKNEETQGKQKIHPELKISLSLLSSHVSDFDVISMKFAPFDQNTLVSCGRENIKFWRLKSKSLTGSAVVLKNYARDSIFSALDFWPVSEQPSKSQIFNLIVGASSGFIFKVNCQTREVETVFKVHDSGILALIVRNGICVTGSLDKRVRVWPPDFSECLLEARQDFAVVGLDLSEDGMRILAGTFRGGLICLDLSGQTSKICLNSIGREIGQILCLSHKNKEKNEENVSIEKSRENSEKNQEQFADKKPSIESLSVPETNRSVGGRILSLGRDNSIRVWEDFPLRQALEFECRSREEECLCVAEAAPGLFLGGFSSGVLRVFDLSTLSVICENRVSKAAISNLSSAQNAGLAIAGDEQEIYRFVDLKANCALVKCIEGDPESETPAQVKGLKVSSSFSRDEKLIALLVCKGKRLDFYALEDLSLASSLNLQEEAHTVQFSVLEQEHLFALTVSSSVLLFEIGSQFQFSAKLLREIRHCHKIFTSAVLPIFQGQVFATTGGDGLVKIWGLYDNDECGCFSICEHSGPVLAMAFDKETSRLFTAGKDEGFFVWSLNFDEARFLRDKEKVSLMIKSENKENVRQIYQKMKEKSQFDGCKKIVFDFAKNKNEESDAIKKCNHEENKEVLAEEKNQDLLCEGQNKIEITDLNAYHNHPSRISSPGQTAGDCIAEQLNEDPSFANLNSQPVFKTKSTLANKKKSKSPTILGIFEYQQVNCDQSKKLTAQNLTSQKRNEDQNFTIGTTHYKNFNACASNPNLPSSEQLSLKPKTICGISVCSAFNLYWDKKITKSLYYFFENKLIVEELTEFRTQKIFHLDYFVTCLRPKFKVGKIFIGTHANSSTLKAPIVVFDLKLQAFKYIDLHRRGVQSLAVSPCGGFLLSIGHASDRKAFIFDLNNGKTILEESVLDFSYQAFFEFSPKAKFYFCGFTAKNKIKIFQFSAEEPAKIFSLEKYFNYSKLCDLELNSLCFKAKGTSGLVYSFFVGTSKGGILSFDLELGKPTSQSAFKNACQIFLGLDQITKIKFAKGASLIQVATSSGKFYSEELEKMGQIIPANASDDIKIAERRFNLNHFNLISFPSGVLNFESSEAGSQGVALLQSGDVHYFDLAARRQTLFIGGLASKDPVSIVLAIKGNSQQNDLFVTIQESGIVCLWRTASGEKLRQLCFSQAITCALYEEEMKALVLFALDQKIILVDVFDQKKNICYLEQKREPNCEPEGKNEQSQRQFVTFALKLNFGLLPKFLLICEDGSILLTDLILKQSLEILSLQFLETKPRIIDSDYHRSGFLALSNNKGKIFVYRNQNFFAGPEEIDFSMHAEFKIESKKTSDYFKIASRFEQNGACANFLYVITNQSEKFLIFDFVNKQAI